MATYINESGGKSKAFHNKWISETSNTTTLSESKEQSITTYINESDKQSNTYSCNESSR